jgi:hypothetical protein
MNEILASPVLQICAILLTVGLLYRISDRETDIDIDIWKFKIKGGGGKEK